MTEYKDLPDPENNICFELVETLFKKYIKNKVDVGRFFIISEKNYTVLNDNKQEVAVYAANHGYKIELDFTHDFSQYLISFKRL